MARTFSEIAERARTSYTGDMLTGTLELVEELAEAMERLEYNIAVQLAQKGQHVSDETSTMRALIANNVTLLREPIGREDG